MTEQEVNRLLRRLDWRFLLPSPRAKLAFSLAGGSLHDALHLIADCVTRSPAQGKCDLAVVEAPTSEKLRLARESLVAGGFLYAEWAQPRPGGVGAVRRELQRSGFAGGQIYWAWPMTHQATPLFWLPIEQHAAMAHFFAHRPASRNRRERIRRAVSQYAWRAGLRFGLAFPLRVIAQNPASDVARSQDSDSCLLLTGGHSSLNKVVALKFKSGEAKPHTVVKWGRVPQSQQALEREAAMLQCLHALHTEGIAGVPRARIIHPAGDGALAIEETALEGQPVHLQLSARNFRVLSLQAAEWLVKLVSVGQSAHASSRHKVHALVQEFEQRCGGQMPAGALHRLREILAKTPDLPRAFEQRDFSPWNVQLDANGAFVVLDWESAEADGLPALDLIYFIAHLAFFVDGAMAGGNMLAAYRKLLSSKSDTGRVFAEALTHYALRTKISLEALRPLRLLTWMAHACSEHRRREGQPDNAKGLFLTLLETDLHMPEVTLLQSPSLGDRVLAWDDESPAR